MLFLTEYLLALFLRGESLILWANWSLFCLSSSICLSSLRSRSALLLALLYEALFSLFCDSSVILVLVFFPHSFVLPLPSKHYAPSLWGGPGVISSAIELRFSTSNVLLFLFTGLKTQWPPPRPPKLPQKISLIDYCGGVSTFPGLIDFVGVSLAALDSGVLLCNLPGVLPSTLRLYALGKPINGVFAVYGIKLRFLASWAG